MWLEEGEGSSLVAWRRHGAADEIPVHPFFQKIMVKHAVEHTEQGTPPPLSRENTQRVV